MSSIQTTTAVTDIANAKKAAESIKPAIKKHLSTIEERLKLLEDADKISSLQIYRLNKAKSEVLRLKSQVEKSAASSLIARERCSNDIQLRQAQKIVKLKNTIEGKDAEYQNLKKNLLNKQAQKYTKSLQKQLDVAEEKQKLLEIEKIRILRDGKNYLRGCWWA